jgi:hypothetical protein
VAVGCQDRPDVDDVAEVAAVLDPVAHHADPGQVHRILGERIDHQAERGDHVHGFGVAELAGGAKINQHVHPRLSSVSGLRNISLVAEGHHVRADDTGDLGEPLDDLDADPHALIGHPLRRHAAQPANHGIGHVDPGHLGADVLQRAQ